MAEVRMRRALRHEPCAEDRPSEPREESGTVARCETCGNDYDKSFDVVMRGESHTFDSFECAIHALAPTCAHCGCRIIGHGMEKNGTMYCCATCAEHEGAPEMVDRV
jgi:hypothetical protein